MKHATRGFHNRIAVVFDFDKTLAPGSLHALLAHCGFDPEEFERERIKPLAEAGWDEILAQFYALIAASQGRDDLRITRDLVEEVGRNIEPYEGVLEMFDRVRAAAQAIVSDVEVEFYLLTCGLVDLQRKSRLAEKFNEMWGTELHYDEDGVAVFVKQMITFPEKVRYMLQLSRGTGVEGPNEPADLYVDVPEEDVHVPLDQIVYVGDGGSDMPVFAMMHERGGLTIGVFEAETAEGWAGHSGMRADSHVNNLAPADFRENSELMRSLILAVESIAKLVALRRLGKGE